MQKLKTCLHYIDLTSEWAGKIVSFLIIFIIIAVIWDVLLRYVFLAYPMWGIRSYGNLLLVYVIYGGAYTLLIRGHVNADILYRRFSLRTKAIADLVTSILLFTLLITLIYHAIPSVFEYIERFPIHVSLKLLHPARWPDRLLVPLGFFLFFFQGLAKFIRDFITAVTGRETL